MGLFTSIVFLLFLGVAIFIGYKLGKKNKTIQHDPVSDEEKRKAQEMQSHFSRLMTYDVDVALGKRVSK